MRGLLPLLLVGGVLWVLSQGDAVQDDENVTRPGNIDRSLLRLVPPFREKVLTLLQRMREQGFRPLVWETYRSPQRAARLAEQGTGVRLSMHSLGLAVDIVDAVYRWDAKPDFWAALGRNARELGLEWGGTWKQRVDKPHVQAGPASDVWQNKMRAATPTQREELLRRQYA